MQKELITQLHKNFEDCAHERDGMEFWYARELQVLLGYDKWDNFENVIEKAKIACQNAKQAINDHFLDVTKTIAMPKGATKEIQDAMLTRYACYLIAQNGDPRKDKIAFAMTYFAVQTRKQEVIEERLKNEGNESVTNCHQLKMEAEDGKLRETDAVDVKTILRLVQSVPSPKAEPIKLWLARVGYEPVIMSFPRMRESSLVYA